MNILIVDDDVVLAKTLCKQLEVIGWQASTLSRPEEIEAALPAVRPNILFMDIDLSGESGIEWCRRVRTFAPGLPLIFISSQLSPEIKVQALEAGGMAYVDKPLTAHLLAAYARRYATEWEDEVPSESGSTVHLHQIEVRLEERLLCFADGSMRDLSPMQTTVLQHLMAHMGEMVPKEDLSYEVWRSRDMIRSREQSLHNTIHRLRVMLSTDPAISISNVRGMGYILEVNR